MSIRLFMATLLACVLIASIAFIALISLFLEGQLAPLVSSVETSAAFQALIIQMGLASFLFSVALLAVMFFAVGRFIGKPITTVVAAMEEFAKTGTQAPLQVAGGPKEIQALAAAFSSFAGHVDEAHKRDTEISRVKSDFISTAAHQLRTPLTGIRWALEALQLEQLTEGQKALVASAVEKSHQLVAVVGTLLDISSIESGKYKYDFSPVVIDSLAAEVTHDFEPLAAKSQVALSFEKAGASAAVVRADRERIRWVLNNLIENAIRYTPPSGSVHVTTEIAPGRVYVRVRDTGIGIAPKDRGNIFERFYRAPNAIAKENGGNGLGLYIARTIANDHGGDLNFETNEGGLGTVFTLSLPLSA